jgi:LmbE family N-acetylglucosaminyl deacetylase/tetratricopeptide (TPR) repeat protein
MRAPIQLSLSIFFAFCAVGASSARSAAGVRSPVESEPKIQAAHKDLAKQYAQNGALADAIREYQAALAANPNDGDARLHLAEVFSWSGDYDRSLVTYEDLLKTSPSNLEARIGMAQVLRWSHRYADAEQQLQSVLKVDPENLDALKGMAQTYALAGDFGRSLSFLDRGISHHPHDAELVAQKGTVLSWSGNLQEGIALLKTAVTLDPSSASAYRSLADAYTWRKEFSRAAENYRRALDIEPRSVETALDLARAYQKAGERTMAEEVVTQVLRLAPSHHQAIKLLQEIRRDDRLETARAMDVIGEPIAFLAILSLPTVVFYKRQRRTIWQAPQHRKLYRIVFPVLSLLFLAAYGLHIVFETSVYYKISEIVLLIAIGVFTLLLFRETRPAGSASAGASVLVIGAHPDDIELGAAGSLLKLAQEGAKVYGLVLTQGEIGSEAPIGTRADEARQGASHLGLSDLWILNFPDTHLREHITEIRAVIEEKIKEFGVQIVITHSPHETHGDHVAVFEAAKEAARKCSLLCYESISAPKEFVPNYFVNITPYLPDKLSAVSSHRTQRGKFYMDEELVKGRAAHRGLQAGVPYAEAFWVYRWVR